MLYFTIQNRLQAGTSQVSEAAGARWRFYRRISSDYGRIVFLLAEALQGFSSQILTFKISWQAQYLVRLEGDLTGSAHWKWRFICDDDVDFVWQVQYLVRLGGDFTGSTHWKWGFICDANHSWHSFCVAGAVFGEVGGWLDLLTHWKWAFICDADHRWYSFCVAGAVFGEVGGRLYFLHALEMSFHMGRRSLMTFIFRGRRSIWWSWTVTLVAPRSRE